MIKVVIIDDDIEMLIGLRKIINWEEYGYTVVGEADNGEKGLEVIKEFKPEVVITDITMPAMNGLDLIEKAQGIVPNIKPIILTCHEDFNYAKQALQLKACDYVLKYTLTKEILLDIINNLKERIQSEKRINTKILTIGEEIKLSNDILKQKILKDLITCNDTDAGIPKIRKEAEIFDIKLPDGAYVLVNIFIDNFDLNLENAKLNNQLLDFAMENIFHEVYGDCGEYNYFNYSKDIKSILFWADSNKDNFFNVSFVSKLRNYQKYINENLKIEISICISSIYNDILNINQAYDECKKLRNEYFYKDSLSIIKSQKEKWSNYSNLYGKYKNEWIEVLLTDSSEKIVNFIMKLSNEIRSLNYSPDLVKPLFNNLIIDIKSMANKNGIEINCNTGFDTMNSCVQSIENTVINYYKGLQNLLNRNFRIEIKKVLQFIDENLNEHISCDKMAEYIRMNTNYFSRLFKKEIGMSFSDYVINKRIEKAKYFLKYSELPVDEVAFLTGFKNVCYFYKIYKKVTGKTPGDSRSA